MDEKQLDKDNLLCNADNERSTLLHLAVGSGIPQASACAASRRNSFRVLCHVCVVLFSNNSGGSREGARGARSPYFWTKLRPKGPKKNFCWDRSPPPPLIWRSVSATEYCQLHVLIAHNRYIKFLTWLRGFLVIFLYVFFLGAQVSSGNCETMES